MHSVLKGILVSGLIVAANQMVQAQASFCLGINNFGQTVSLPCNTNVNDPENHDYNTSPTVDSTTGGFELTLQRQQDLLRKAILQGQNDQTLGNNFVTSDLPQRRDTNFQSIDYWCTQQAIPAFDAAKAAYDQAGIAFQNAALQPYIYDQLRAQNAAYQQYQTAQNLYAEANKQALNCQSAHANEIADFTDAGAEIGANSLRAKGQLQEQQAAQRQWEVDKAAQDGRTIFGLQNNVTNLLQGIIPPRTSIPTSPRPRVY